MVRNFRLAKSLLPKKLRLCTSEIWRLWEEILKYHVCNFLKFMGLRVKPDIPEHSMYNREQWNPAQYTIQLSYTKGSNSTWNSAVSTYFLLLSIKPERVEFTGVDTWYSTKQDTWTNLTSWACMHTIRLKKCNKCFNPNIILYCNVTCA